MAVCDFMAKEQQIKVRKLQQEKGIKPPPWPTSTEVRVAALEMKLRVSLQLEQLHGKENWGETP